MCSSSVSASLHEVTQVPTDATRAVALVSLALRARRGSGKPTISRCPSAASGDGARGRRLGLVREQTRRRRGAGSASLAFDGALAGLETRGGAYTGRFGPWVLGAVVDAGGDSDLGATYQRPLETRDYRVALRLTRGEYTAADGSHRFDARAFEALGEIIFASTTFDASIGLERFSSVGPDAERKYASSGVRTKLGVVTVSVEGHVGRIEEPSGPSRRTLMAFPALPRFRSTSYAAEVLSSSSV